MPSPFPGVDPYLERKGLWSEVHAGLIAAIQRELGPRLRPNYRVAIERSSYSVMLGDVEPVGKPDMSIIETSPSAESSEQQSVVEFTTATPVTALVPMLYDFDQGFLEIRETGSQRVVTIIELLSHANKQGHRGREQYRKKRDDVLASATNLVEIDLLRAGTRPPIELNDDDDYALVVSRRPQRPRAHVYLFSVRDRIPIFPIPLKPNEAEPLLDLNSLLADLYDLAAYDMSVDYTQPPTPRLDAADAEWAQAIVNSRPEN